MSSSVTRSSGAAGRRDALSVGPRSVLATTVRAFDDDLHARTVQSLANGVTGVLECCRARWLMAFCTPSVMVIVPWASIAYKDDGHRAA